MYPLPATTTAWIRALGAFVMTHELTFTADVLKTAELPEFAWIKGVISTYLRTEVHLIKNEFSKKFKPDNVDLTYVIWGDLDTIWLKDFDSCTLAKPTILSVTGANTNDPNAGVGYYNTTAMSMIFGDMISYARSKAFKFSALDNTLMAEFAGSKFTALPYFFNWRPYWGDVPQEQWARDGGGKKYILHVHGPKLDKTVCTAKGL
ncbi:g5395 [Coccomyxa elongata]